MGPALSNPAAPLGFLGCGSGLERQDACCSGEPGDDTDRDGGPPLEREERSGCTVADALQLEAVREQLVKGLICLLESRKRHCQRRPVQLLQSPDALCKGAAHRHENAGADCCDSEHGGLVCGFGFKRTRDTCSCHRKMHAQRVVVLFALMLFTREARVGNVCRCPLGGMLMPRVNRTGEQPTTRPCGSGGDHR